MQRLILIVLSAFFFVATPAFAQDAAGNWIVSQRSGDVRVVHHGLQQASVRANTSLSPGDVVMTGATGRATLARGADYIVVAPRSELKLPAEAQPGGFTRVVQRLGTMLFKVKHTGVPHFAVDTPMLAAVVKGTTFTVIVDKDRSAVQVIEGVVQVVATDGGMQKLVEGGNTVFIDRNNPKQLLLATPQNLGPVGAASGTAVRINGSGDQSVSEIASLTTGLVRAEPVPAPAVAPTQLALLVTPSAPLTSVGTLNPDPAAQNPSPTGPGDGVVTVTVPPVTDVLAIVDPLVDPLAAPVVDPILGSVVDPIVAPIVDTLVDPIFAPVVDTLVDPVVAPIVAAVDPIVAPIVDTVVDPIVAPIVAVVDPIVAPFVDTVVDPIVAVVDPIVTPIVDTVVDPLVAPIVAVVDPIVAPIVDTVVDPIVAVVDPIATPIVDTVVDPVVAPIVAVVDPIVTPIVDTVVDPIVAVVDPIVTPIVDTVVDPIVAPIVAVVDPIVAPIVDVLPVPPLPPVLPPLFGL
jgi:hypothetical protein